LAGTPDWARYSMTCEETIEEYLKEAKDKFSDYLSSFV